MNQREIFPSGRLTSAQLIEQVRQTGTVRGFMKGLSLGTVDSRVISPERRQKARVDADRAKAIYLEANGQLARGVGLSTCLSAGLVAGFEGFIRGFHREWFD